MKPHVQQRFRVGVAGMAYARIAAMPPVNGLYTNIICPAVYALFGTTRHAAIGIVFVLFIEVRVVNLRDF